MSISSDHIVLVTGATSGFGRAIAARFATGGAKVIAAGRRAERLAGLAAEHPGRIHPLPLDVRDAAAVFKAVRVTSIEPGMAETEFALVRFQDKAKAKAVYEGVTPLSAADVAGVVFYAATQPAHVNINRIELMPTQQGFGPFAVHRD